MPSYLFHQNMRVFGPNTPWRTYAYGGGAPPAVPMPVPVPAGAGPVPAGGAFAQIAGGLGAGNIVIAGLTEVTTYATLVAINQFKLPLLGPGNHEALLVACGRTALRTPLEYVALLFKTKGAGARVRVLEVGRVMLAVSGNATTTTFDTAPAAPVAGPRPWAAWAAWAQTAPAGNPDFRALVYAIVTLPGAGTIGVAFWHNMYSLDDQRNLAAGKLPQIMSSLKVRVGRLAPAGNPNNVYLGGDFNVLPTDRRGGVRSLTLHAYEHAAPALYGSMGGGTTWAGRMYDYWYSDIPPPVPPLALPQASSSALTRDHGTHSTGWTLMSDHAAILLQVT